MSSLVSLFLALLLPFLVKDTNKTALSQMQEQNYRGYYGSIDFDSEGNLVFYHVPQGKNKFAIQLIHKISFEKRSDKLLAFKNVGKNVYIKADVVKLNDLEILLVNQIEILELEVI